MCVRTVALDTKQDTNSDYIKGEMSFLPYYNASPSIRMQEKCKGLDKWNYVLLIQFKIHLPSVVALERLLFHALAWPCRGDP